MESVPALFQRDAATALVKRVDKRADARRVGQDFTRERFGDRTTRKSCPWYASVVRCSRQSDRPQNEARVAAAKSERIRHRHAHIVRLSLIGDQAKVDVRIFEVNGRRNGLVA